MERWDKVKEAIGTTQGLSMFLGIAYLKRHAFPVLISKPASFSDCPTHGQGAGG